MKRQIAERRGRQGERRAALWLQLKGWAILERRKKTPLGEIDLIARKGNLIAFFEVKWRNSAAELDLAIDEYRLRRVAAAVDAVAHQYATRGEDIRIDVILLSPNSFPRHIENAWMP
jgi:putative endonuclease